ncbi:YadA-like family protein [Citrobacter sp. wls619]|uniref:YadA-like family protein n=1 Tax=Citrobacter sp. wls619 TaxID=2576432 RepID=UPI00148545FB|nr:YadA-like family protein [Citrobacter sp. wls619]
MKISKTVIATGLLSLLTSTSGVCANTCTGDCGNVHVYGDKNTLINQNPDPDSYYSLVIGEHNNAENSDHMIVTGDFNEFKDVSKFSVVSGGHNTIADAARTSLVGNENNVSGTDTNVFGSQNSLTGDNSAIFGSGSSVAAENAIAIGNNSTNDRDNTLSVGSEGNERQITHVAAGTADTDAVNKKQLDDMSTSDRRYTDDRVTTAENNARQYTDTEISHLSSEMTQYVDNSADGTYKKSADYTRTTVQESSAQNMKYTDAVSAKTLEQANTWTDKRFSESVAWTDTQINNVNNRVDRLDNKIDDNRQRASAGIAGAMAMSTIPQNLSYDFTFGMGVANFDSEQAMSAGGYYKVSPHVVVSLKTSYDTQHNTGIATGMSLGW